MHTLIYDSTYRDLYYGLQRDFEDEICRVTGAKRFELPVTPMFEVIQRVAPTGVLNRRFLRSAAPKLKVNIPGDVVWIVLNNPSNYTMDLYDLRFSPSAKRILYVTDAFDHHEPIYKKIIRPGEWNLLITSIHGAKPYLEALTGQKWHVVSQGINLSRFSPCTQADRLIDICSYGRRVHAIHENTKVYCAEKKLYYDYTTWSGVAPDCDNQDHYAQFAWHLGHSASTICYPRELTHPNQLSRYGAITTRYFEAVASGTPIIGQLPVAPEYEEVVGERFFIPLSPNASREEAFATFEELFSRKSELLKRAREYYQTYRDRWTWESRVHQILKLL